MTIYILYSGQRHISLCCWRLPNWKDRAEGVSWGDLHHLGGGGGGLDQLGRKVNNREKIKFYVSISTLVMDKCSVRENVNKYQ